MFCLVIYLYLYFLYIDFAHLFENTKIGIHSRRIEDISHTKIKLFETIVFIRFKATTEEKTSSE